MPATSHAEKHFTATEIVRDVVIGMADGLQCLRFSCRPGGCSFLDKGDRDRRSRRDRSWRHSDGSWGLLQRWH
jgi:hypothetical protein